VDHPVSVGGAGAERAQIGEVAANALRSGGLEGRGGRVGAGEGEDGVAVAEQFGDDGGTDQPGAAGDENLHEVLLQSDGSFVPSL
jgi:hypothetical protein